MIRRMIFVSGLSILATVYENDKRVNMKKAVFLASLAVMTASVWGMKNHMTPYSSSSKNSDMINISDTSMLQNTAVDENLGFQESPQTRILTLKNLNINQIQLLYLFPQKQGYLDYLTYLNSYMQTLYIPEDDTEANNIQDYLLFVFRSLKKHYDEDFEKHYGKNSKNYNNFNQVEFSDIYTFQFANTYWIASKLDSNFCFKAPIFFFK